jgi:hypothetical protein
MVLIGNLLVMLEQGRAFRRRVMVLIAASCCTSHLLWSMDQLNTSRYKYVVRLG